MAYRLAILTTTINPETIEPMVQLATEQATSQGAEIVSVTKTLGCLDMPIVGKMLYEQEEVDAIVVLGAVAQGGTKHDELVVNLMTEKMVDMSLEYNKPVTFGVIGPGAKPEQFAPRVEEYAQRAVEAAIVNLDILQS